MLELTAATAGIPAVGFFAQVPHYVNATYPTASIALLTALGRYLGIELPVGQLATRALERRNLLDAATATDEDTKAHVERLELLADESRLPEGDELIADIERFLREGGRRRRARRGRRLPAALRRSVSPSSSCRQPPPVPGRSRISSIARRAWNAER